MPKCLGIKYAGDIFKVSSDTSNTHIFNTASTIGSYFVYMDMAQTCIDVSLYGVNQKRYRGQIYLFELTRKTFVQYIRSRRDV